MHMGVTEEAIRKAKYNVNAPMECWGCTNYPIYHKCPNNMYPDVAERAKPSIKEYNQFNPAMGGSRGSQGIQYGKGQTSSTTTRSMFAELRYQLSQSWNEEGFSSLYQALLICAMVEPYNLRSAQVACAADI